MIGVVFSTGESAAVEEFFQLFKTPWEPAEQGRDYDVLLVSGGSVPEAAARLILIYGSTPTEWDAAQGLVGTRIPAGDRLRLDGLETPLHGDALVFQPSTRGVSCLEGSQGSVGLRITREEQTVLRIGYDLFGEVARLLSLGQPVDLAHFPSLDLHIHMLRRWMLGAGVEFIEIPPVPSGYPFAVTLTHDIDFMGIRRHKLDHTVAGFLYRATVGALLGFCRGGHGFGKLMRSWSAAASLPLVYLGLVKDFWMQFDAYRAIEKGLSATYYFIPFKHRAGDKVGARHPSRRAAPYDISEIPELISTLMKDGCEVGVHGLDAWHSVEKGREELARGVAATGRKEIGIRMHWLLRDASTVQTLEQAGFAYDSTFGYNETVGYWGGTGQVFRPPGARRMLELPMHIQDGALFYQQRLGLSESEAWSRCEVLIDAARRFGGVLTVLWHDRSLGPERYWGDFYVRLVNRLKSLGVWFAQAGQVVTWFRRRREVVFERGISADGTAYTRLRLPGGAVHPPLVVRRHKCRGEGDVATGRTGPGFIDEPWGGESMLEFGMEQQTTTGAP